ncbi:MAG: peptidoglycan DD-metalloendopeptidase family protein, partial [Rhodospirillales bacterium]|nr:peptidoglycan DD-metalloendopeptidase family protein [Rhodospirillales bacterium]
LQGQMVRAAADIRAIERQVETLDAHLEQLEARQSGLQAQYDARRGEMAATLAALARMGRTPRAAVLIRPGGPLMAARTSMVLSSGVPVIEKQAAAARALIDDLSRTQSELAQKADEARNARADLSARHDRLAALMQTRGASDPDAQRQAAALARDARSLRDLLRALDHGADVQDALKQVKMPPPGEGQLPVSGIIRVAYGAKTPAGLTSSGLSIETLPGAVVVAPMGGIVKYAGAFRGYGNIIIIQHESGYHSLIAGLDKITVSAGQAIVSGEPIAILEGTDRASRDGPALRRSVYYELRQGGQPINPARKLPDLGS